MIAPSTRAATLGVRATTDSEPRLLFLYTVSAVAFLLAAAALAVVRSVEPFDHGWWLVSYLALVGGVSQLLLGAGRLMLAGTRASAPRRRRTPWGELVLWNVGTLLVPMGVLTDTPEVVAAGSVVLLVALVLFAAASRTPAAAGPARHQRSYLWAYRGLVAFLAGSVVVGAGLAEALPWQ
jgi:hypothetical protein